MARKTVLIRVYQCKDCKKYFELVDSETTVCEYCGGNNIQEVKSYEDE